MRHHIYIEDNAGDWVNFSDRVVHGVGKVTYAAKSGQPILGPPTQLKVDNDDAYWITEPDDSGSDFFGSWEDRRVKITREAGFNRAEELVGTFRIVNEEGFKANRDGTGTLKIEALSEQLKRGDAADVSFGRGWFSQLPWTLAVDKLRRPEDQQALAFPDAPVPYEFARRACSSLGTPGDCQADGWHEIRSKAVDQTYNQNDDVHACLTLDGRIFEYDRATGRWTEITVTASLPSEEHAVRFWHRYTAAGSGYYVIQTSRAYGDYSYYDPWASSTRTCNWKLWRHDQAGQLASIGNLAHIAPNQVRNIMRPKSVAHDNELAYGNEYLDYRDRTPPYSGIQDRKENIILPFDQFPYVLQSRDSALFPSADIDTIEVKRQRIGGGWQHSPLNAFTPDADGSWTQEPIIGAYALAEERFRDSELRAGRGYYTWVLRCDDGAWSDTDPDSYNHEAAGLIHNIGQGPVFDFSHEHTGGATWADTFWVTWLQWDNPARRWLVKCGFLDTGGTLRSATVKTCDAHVMPTFLVCDITRPSDAIGAKGNIIIGWADWAGSADHERGPGGNTYGTCYMAVGGVDVYTLESQATSGSSPVFFTLTGGGPTVLKMQEQRNGETIVRYYDDAEGANNHISGRWLPIAAGFRRYNSTPNNQGKSYYNVALCCIDRMEMGPTECGTSEPDDRAGLGTYRILYVKIIVSVSGGVTGIAYATSITDTYGPGYDIQFRSPMPLMGFTRLCTGEEDDEVVNNNTDDIYFYSVGDGGLYACKPNDVDLLKPYLIGTVPHNDRWMGMGTLAVANDGGDRTKPVVMAVSTPAFPCSQKTAWPDGSYLAWIFDSSHSGRLPLLETSGMDKLKALNLAAAAGDSIFYFTRTGLPKLRRYPADATGFLLSLTPSDNGSATRGLLALVNHATRSVNDIVPGEGKISVDTAPGSRFNARPSFTGLGNYPVDIDLRCVSSGQIQDSPARVEDRIELGLTTAHYIGDSYITVVDVSDVLVGDLVSITDDDAEIRVEHITTSNRRLWLARELTAAHNNGTTVYVDRVAPAAADPKLGMVNWGWRMTGKRIQANLRLAAAAGSFYLYLDQLEGIDLGDRVTLSLDDEDLIVDNIVEQTGRLRLSSALAQTYAAGVSVWVDKSFDAHWSHQLRWDEKAEVYRGIAEVGEGTAWVGRQHIYVNTLEPFAVGTLFRIHSKTGLDTETYNATYRVIRTRSAAEGNFNLPRLDFERVGGAAGGLVAAVSAGDPITAVLNVPPIGASARIGQSGVVFSLSVAGELAVNDDGTMPVSDGDTVRISFPGLISKKNEFSKVTAHDRDSIETYDLRKTKRRTVNKLLDYELALMDVFREVRRKADPLIYLELRGCVMSDPDLQATLIGLEPWDVVKVTDYDLLRDRAGYLAYFLVTRHSYDLQTGAVDLRLEELDLSEPGGRFGPEANELLPKRVDLTATADDASVFLDWSPGPDDDWDGVDIYWSTKGPMKTQGEGTLLGSFVNTIFATKHMSLANGTTYYYAAFAKDTEAPTKYSGPSHAVATPQSSLPAIANFAAASGDEEVALSWDAIVTPKNLVGFTIRYRTDGSYPSSSSDGDLAGVAPLGATSFTHEGLQNGLQYSYKIWGVDGAGNESAAQSAYAIPDFDPDLISDYIEANWTAHSLLPTVADTDPIDDLADSSAAGHDLEKYSDAARPTLTHVDANFNGLAVVEHDPSGGAKLLKATSLWDPFIEGAKRGGIVIWVGELDVVSTSYTPISHYGGSPNYFWYWRGSRFVIYEDNVSGAPGGYALLTISAMTATTPGIYAIRYLPRLEVRGYSDGIAEPEDGNDDGDAPVDVTGAGMTMPITVGTTYATGNPVDGRWGQILLLSDAGMGAFEALLAKLRRKFQGLGVNPTGLGSFNDDFSEDFDVRGPSYNNDFSDDFDVLTTG